MSFWRTASPRDWRRSSPTGKFFRNVHWRDPTDGRSYETDLLAIIGSHALDRREQGRGRRSAAGAPGQGTVLRKEIKRLLVSPAIQAQRMARFIASKPGPEAFTDGEDEAMEIDCSG